MNDREFDEGQLALYRKKRDAIVADREGLMALAEEPAAKCRELTAESERFYRLAEYADAAIRDIDFSIRFYEERLAEASEPVNP